MATPTTSHANKDLNRLLMALILFTKNSLVSGRVFLNSIPELLSPQQRVMLLVVKGTELWGRDLPEGKHRRNLRKKIRIHTQSLKRLKLLLEYLWQHTHTFSLRSVTMLYKTLVTETRVFVLSYIYINYQHFSAINIPSIKAYANNKCDCLWLESQKDARS